MNLTTLHQSTLPTAVTYKPRVLLPSKVYSQILTLVHNFSSEIGWAGVVTKQNTNTYVIDSIMVYPQLVSGATVEDDHEQYAAWVGQQDIDTLMKTRLYGHSHVNMNVYPSGVDEGQFDKYVNQVDDFYIMMIVNKRNEFRIDIYDKVKNLRYTGCEFLISYEEDKELLDEANKLVKKKYVAPTYNYGYPMYGTVPRATKYYPQQVNPNRIAEKEEADWMDQDPEITAYYERQAARAYARGKKFFNKKGEK